VDQKVVFADIGSVVRGKAEEAILTEITTLVEREEPAVVVIDSFKAVREMVPESAVRTSCTISRSRSRSWGAASLLVASTPRRRSRPTPNLQSADGIIRLINRHQELSAVREVEVVKLRGADYVTGRHFFEIGTAGLTFFPTGAQPGCGR